MRYQVWVYSPSLKMSGVRLCESNFEYSVEAKALRWLVNYPDDIVMLVDTVFDANLEAYKQEMNEVFLRSSGYDFDIVRCHHFEGKKRLRVPCPLTCPRQSWPQSKFRRTFWTGRWKLRK